MELEKGILIFYNTQSNNCNYAEGNCASANERRLLQYFLTDSLFTKINNYPGLPNLAFLV